MKGDIVDELINLVSQRAGITPDQAKVAVETVVGFLKQKLPPPVASQVDSYLSGGTGGSSAGNPLGKILGG